MRPLRFLPIVLPLAALTLGCTGNVAASGESADAEASAITAVVVVERTSGNALNQAETTRGEAVARFVRMRSGAVDEDALRSVGAVVDFPALGSCARLSGGSADAMIFHALDLIDVGAVSLESDSFGTSGSLLKTSLVARRLPDVADLVSGVVYTARANNDDGSGFPARGHYVFRAAGSPGLDVAAFAVESSVVGEPADVHVGGLEPRAGERLLVSPTSLVDVTWTPGETDDLIYIDVASATTSTALNAPINAPIITTRCLFTDSGRATLSGSSFGDADGTVTTHRLHREVFHARGIDAGELRFDFARAVSFRRR